MRGQEPGSEHDRREADGTARPATPPPSFGRTSGQDVPPAFPPAEEADDGETRTVIPVLKGPPPGLPDPQPGDAQPWEVPDDDAAPYDWFADETDTDPTLASRAPALYSRADRGLPAPPPNAPQSASTDSAPAEQAPATSSPAERMPAALSPAEHMPPAASSPGDRPPVGASPAEPGAEGPVAAEGPAAGPPWAGRGATAPGAAEQPQPGREQAGEQAPTGGPLSETPWPSESSWAGQKAADSPWASPLQPGADEKQADRGPAEPVNALPPWPVEPVVPGAPPWDPPPAFTAAAAGMPVWPGPDPHAMPPWPAATGELVAEPDADEPDAPGFDPNATEPEGITRPAHYFDPEAAKRDAAQQRATQPGIAPSGISQPAPAQAAAAATQASTTEPAAAEPGSTQQEAAAQETSPGAPPDETTQQRTTVPLAAPVASEHEDTRPVAREDAAPGTSMPRQETRQPAHYFDPKAAEHDQAPTGPASLFDPNATTPATVRPPEPGDVPVWPPLPPAGQKLPDLPFSRESWGQRSSTALDLPTPPQGTGPAFPPGAFKQPPFQTPPPPPAPPGKSKRALLVTLGALALAGVATGGFFAYQAVSKPAATTAASRGGTTAPSTPAEVPESTPTDLPGASVLNSEQTDPQKLSLSEAFPKKKVSAAGTTFTRVKAGMETTCDKAATGAFAEALKEQKCSRVLRATYVDSKRRYAVTTGIAVLPTKDAATAADQAKNLSKNVWFRPLPGAAGSGGERVHIAGGYAAGLVWGRYIVFSYATHADGHTPAAKEKTLPKVSGAFRDQTSLVLERRVTD